jgi:signal transduction histidine kinase
MGSCRKRAEEELARLNTSLEQRIAARTAELVEANAQLTAAMAERERAEAALRQAQKMEAIGQLTAGIAHDFNNLLTAVIGNLDLASQRAKDDPPQARLLEGAARAAEHGAMLTQRLLAFGRKQHLMAQPVDAAALLDEMRDMLARSLGPTIQLALAPEPDLWLARVDPHQLELMIMNLAINARDAMPDGGILTITMTNRGIMDGVPSGLSAGEYVLITVQDTGMGMDEATLKRAFEPFFTTKEIGKGSGLGLSMVHGVAAQSGGTARARSRLGEGTRVEVWLPRAATARPPKSIAEPAPEATLVETTILLCDDDPEVRGFVGTCLGELGCRVLWAANGAEALAVLDSDAPVDLLVIDFAMPGMTGVAVARAARERRPGLPALLITGYADVAALANQADGLPILNKPFKRADLVAALSNCRLAL